MNDNDDMPLRRCSDCSEHSGIEKRLESGSSCMNRLETGLEALKKDFSDHVNSSFKGTIAIMVLVIMCLITSIVGIYTSSIHPKDKYSSQAEMTMLAKAIGVAIKEAKK